MQWRTIEFSIAKRVKKVERAISVIKESALILTQLVLKSSTISNADGLKRSKARLASPQRSQDAREGSHQFKHSSQMPIEISERFRAEILI